MGGDLVARWDHAWMLYSKQFIETAREYGKKLNARVTHDTFVELHYLLMRYRGVDTIVRYDQDEQGHITYALPSGEVTITPHKEVVPYTDRPALPSTAAAIYGKTTGLNLTNRLICVFDFGFNINDVCIHEGERIRDFLLHKGLPRYSDTQLGREAVQKDQLEKMFSERAYEADWNF